MAFMKALVILSLLCDEKTRGLEGDMGTQYSMQARSLIVFTFAIDAVLLKCSRRMSHLPDYPEVMPKRADEARGINFCGADNYYDIIPADVGVYMRSTNFIEGNNIMIYSLTQACQ